MKARWYGTETLIADGAAAALLAGAFLPWDGSASDVAALSAPGAYLLGAPIVHFAHRNLRHGMVSLGLRVSLPILAAATGGFLCTGESERCVMAGLTVGTALAMASDSAILAFERPEPPASHGSEARSPERASDWYGWQTLASDGAALGIGALGFAYRPVNPTFFIAGLGLYGVGAPIVHLSHGNPGRAVASFVMRVPVPIAVGTGAAVLYCRRFHGEFCGLAGFAPGALAMLTAMAVDATLFAHDGVTTDGSPTAATAIPIVPLVVPLGRRLALGVALTL